MFVSLFGGGSPKQEGGQDAEHLKTDGAQETHLDTKLWNAVTVGPRAPSHHDRPRSEDSEAHRVPLRGTPLSVYTAPEPRVNKGSSFLYRSPQRASFSNICCCETPKGAAKSHFQNGPSAPSHKDIRLRLRAGRLPFSEVHSFIPSANCPTSRMCQALRWVLGHKDESVITPEF